MKKLFSITFLSIHVIQAIITLSLKKQIPCDAFELFRMFTEKQPISAKKVLYMFFSYM